MKAPFGDGATRTKLDPDVALLQSICHAFASTSDIGELARACSTWVRAALRDPTAPVRIVVPDHAGRLRQVGQHGGFPGDGRKRSRKRRDVFVSKRPASLELSSRPAHELLILPLVSRGECEGLLEVVASRHRLAARRATLEAVVSQTAIALRTCRRTMSLAAEIENTERAAALASEMVRVGTPGSAARAALRFCYQRFRVPVAAWIGEGDGSPLTFSGAEGLGTRKRIELRAALPRVESEPSLTDGQQTEISRRFQEVTGAPAVVVVDAGRAVLVAGQVMREDEARLRPWLEILGRLLADVLEHIARVDRANHRNQYLDLGIAWTAHELQGPLHATRATIERLLLSGDLPANEELLTRARDELSRLAELVGSVLRWSVGNAPLRRTHVDVGGLVRLSADAVAREQGEDRVRIRARGPAMVKADPIQFSVATANLIRNALNYSPPGSEVLVTIQSKGDHVTITVKNEGPGIPLDEMKSIFDPLVRGRSVSGGRPGNGLGLFVAKQVVEGHGGQIWLESGNGAGEGSGTVFCIRLALAPPGSNGSGRETRSTGVPEKGRSADAPGMGVPHPGDMKSRAKREARHA